jgi:hypothetical protein
MKKLRQILADVQLQTHDQLPGFNDLIWQLICYPPKMAPRLQQEQLLNEAEKFSLKVRDEYFTGQYLTFNGFKWGNGSKRLLITHGWGSKAVDFADIINALKNIDDLEIIAFDAPGNGSSEGELSNLLLFIQAIEAIVLKYGVPHVAIGHSLGGMANSMAFKQPGITPHLLISIAPLIRLQENFEASMTMAGVNQSAQNTFLKSFADKFGTPASHFSLTDRYSFDDQLNHCLAYDENDQVSPHKYLKEFLDKHPFIKTKKYDGVGHDRIVKSPEMIDDLVAVVKKALLI